MESIGPMAVWFARRWSVVRGGLVGVEPVTPGAQRRAEQAFDRALGRIGKHVDQCPAASAANGDEVGRWQLATRERLREGIEALLLHHPAASCWDGLATDEAFGVTEAFLADARSLCPGFGDGELFQALRNVWIMNCIQWFRGGPVCYTPSMFAYSMLYPCTDNVLDDPGRSEAEKLGFCARLGSWLAGRRAAPADAAEEVVRGLVWTIEGEFPRARFPEVYAALGAIHRAQAKSLWQQRGAGAGRARDGLRLLEVTAEKGGASVVADACLLGGSVPPGELEFQFGFGVLLQLLDDLQDADDDLEAGHRTVVTEAVSSGRPLDEVYGKMFWLVRHVTGLARCFGPRGWAAARELVGGHCTAMLMAAAALRPHRFTPRFARSLEGRSPLGFEFLRGCRERTTALAGRLGHALRGGQPAGLPSPSLAPSLVRAAEPVGSFR